MEPMDKAMDWRAKLEIAHRKKIVEAVIRRLKKLASNRVSDVVIAEVSLKYEEKMFLKATTKLDYIKRLAAGLQQIENKCRQKVAALPANQGLTQTAVVETVGHSSSLQHAPEFLNEFVGNSVGQGIQSNLSSTNSEIHMLRQVLDQLHQHQQQQLQNQNLMQNPLQQKLCPSPVQPNIYYNHQPQTQLQISSPLRQLQFSQQPILPLQPYQQLVRQQPNATLIQQNGQFNDPRSVSEQQNISLFWQNMPNLFQKPMGPISNGVGVQQHLERMASTQSNVWKLAPRQNSTPILQQPEVTVPHQNFNQNFQPVQMLLDSKNRSSSCMKGTQQWLQTSTPLLQSQNVDQQRLIHSQRMLPEASPAAIATTIPNEFEHIADWHDQAYTKLQYLKERFLPDAKFLVDMSRDTEVAEQLKLNEMLLNKMIKFMQMSRCDIARFNKEKFDSWLEKIILHLSLKINAISLKHEQQLQPSGDQSQMYQSKQERNETPPVPTSALTLDKHTGSLNSSILNTRGSKFIARHDKFSNDYGSQAGSEQRNATTPIPHDSAISVHQNIVSMAQNTNFSHSTMSVQAADVAIHSLQHSPIDAPVHLQNQQGNHSKPIPAASAIVDSAPEANISDAEFPSWSWFQNG